MAGWQGIDGDVGAAVQLQNKRLLETYEADPRRLEEDANTERSIHEGAYAKRQLFELLQNAADAMRGTDGRCEVVLAGRTLYVANSGEPLTKDGVETLMAAHLSAKRDEQIGRFGLGFKSVLAVTDSPRIYSRSGSLGFDRKWSRARLAELIPGQSHYPVSRLAQPLDPFAARRDDPVLDSLMKWATTVIALPQLIQPDLIASSMKVFPKEFLLFSQHVTQLDIEDRVNEELRSISLTRDADGLISLRESGKTSKWIVVSHTHSPSPEALRDGGYQAARSTVDVSWAAPVEGAQRGVGTFWAFFPTDELTTLSGITNAPWKLADDRASLLPGRFNDELLVEVLPKLVTKALPELAKAGQASMVIDLLPARGKESRGHADDVINQPVFDAVARVQCVPTADNKLRHPTRVKLHPDEASPEELESFLDACTDPENWVHGSLTSAERRSKVVRLLAHHGRSSTDLREWVEHLAKEGDVEGSAAAVRLVAALSARDPQIRAKLARARVLLLEDGSLGACIAGQVFLPGGQEQSDQLIINPVLAAIPEVDLALKSLGIQIFDHAGELRSELARTPVAWERVWSSSRRNTPEDAEAIFRETMGTDLLDNIRVRNFAGQWRPAGMVYLPGEVIPGDGSRDGRWVVDHRFHQQDIRLLERLGMVDGPHRLDNPPLESWIRAKYLNARDQYREWTGNSRLSDETIQIDTGRIFWPLEFLSELSPAARRAVTRKVLRGLSGDERWTITRKDGGKRRTVPDPIWARLANHGVLDTQAGLQPVKWCLAQGDDAVVEGVKQPLPFLEDTVTASQAESLHIRENVSQLPSEAWAALLQNATALEHEPRFLLYAWAALCDQQPPSTLRVLRERGHIDAPTEDVAVTHREDERDSLLAAGIPSIFTTEYDADILVEKWGLSPAEGLLEESVDAEYAGEPTLAVDKFPPLRHALPPDHLELSIQPCNRISLLTSTPRGQRSRPLSSRLEGKTLLTTAIRGRDLLLEIARETNSTFKPDAVLRRMEQQQREKLRVEIAETDDLLKKLVLAIGVDSLQRSIPRPALDALSDSVDQPLSENEIARLALAMDGYSILANHAKELQRRQLDPPSQWAGRRAAREWVRKLGFPIEFAGFVSTSRDAELEVEGPPRLGPLHAYQVKIAKNVQGLLHNGPRANRGLVSLPTGAGKTRVAVQALVESMAWSADGMRVVWVAETDELCEQAIQTWSVVWRAFGAEGIPLTLSRLWAQNEANERDGFQVVVTSISKLDSIVKRGEGTGSWEVEYGWLKEPALIIVDEAHKSISPQYTRTLAALGGRKRVQDITTPLLGLTATPFRGFNNDETKRLAKRYDENLLDEGVFPDNDVYGHLQDMQVLARIRQIELQGSEITLTDEEIDEATNYRLADSVTARLGEDGGRNNTILQSILSLDESAKILLFASSVENARVLAALMTFHGVSARDVSSQTSRAERRQYIEDFKSGKIRVLTNYNVFTEGFDVPTLDAVYITRPTFSPNVYQQMIGRGLRGPLNGGSSEVLIVNVADNLTNYGTEFAFHHFHHLWRRNEP
ncbi:DEAD/DEAH box helicase family protein [Janibacter cremeus]|uniref:DEAD/DEAH box helicase n=1 Tax=Janibacter cremeus TaxID=1285192 RepID=UPI0023F8B6FD|nr:DEAD/DEAH box helicase family protein [Janibacter cremeus]WEV78613.1 DEAD/DEAH box helicase family protein [Janibacter cremeus]